MAVFKATDLSWVLGGSNCALDDPQSGIKSLLATKLQRTQMHVGRPLIDACL